MNPAGASGENDTLYCCVACARGRKTLKDTDSLVSIPFELCRCSGFVNERAAASAVAVFRLRWLPLERGSSRLRFV